jgi:hypothetical protein
MIPTTPVGVLQYANGDCDGAETASRRSLSSATHLVNRRPSGSSGAITPRLTITLSMMGPMGKPPVPAHGVTQIVWISSSVFSDAGRRRPCKIPTAIFDRVRAAGLTTGYCHPASR